MANKISSLNHQASLALKQADGIGTSKHLMKKNGVEEKKIHSFSYKNDLYSVSKELMNYLRSNRFETKINYLRDIKKEHIVSFLESKSTACTQTTLDKYRSQIKTLGIIFNQKYKTINTNYFEVEKVKSLVNYDTNRKMFTPIQVDTLNDYFKDDRQFKNDLHVSIFLSSNYGLRVHEVIGLHVKNINLSSMQLRLTNTKGGRPRTLKIDPDHRKEFEAILKQERTTDKVVAYKTSKSLNNALYRLKNKLFDPVSVRQKSFHALRKFAAQEKYNTYRLNGFSKKESLGMVSEFLGHSYDRDLQLINRYVENIW